MVFELLCGEESGPLVRCERELKYLEEKIITPRMYFSSQSISMSFKALALFDATTGCLWRWSNGTQISCPFFNVYRTHFDSGALTVVKKGSKGRVKGGEVSERGEGSKKKALIQAVGWKLMDGDARDCLERIERCKNTLALAISADET